MRTAIYAYEPTTVKIRTRDPRDAGIEIKRYQQSSNQLAVEVQKLARGIYLVVSRGALEVDGLNIEVQVELNDKDEWPELAARVLALETGATESSVREFFRVAKDLSIDG